MLMIPDSTPSPQTQDWKVVLSESFRHLDDLLYFCEIEHYFSDYTPATQFPFRVTRYFASLIEKGNPADPLLLQVLPDVREVLSVDGYKLDAVGDRQATAVPGLIHKYQARVLLTLTSACAIHCRYCFRRHYPYSENQTDVTLDGQVMQYLAQHSEITEVILSGGDPLMLSDQKLHRLIENLNQIRHIRLLRIHSRLLSVLPERINAQLIAILQQFRGNIVFVTHINHPHEISEKNKQVFQILARTGFSLFNQSVLLKQVNDDAKVLSELCYALFESHVIPYYLHCLDKVQGSQHFDIPRKQACQIYAQLRDSLPGYLLPRMVEEIAGQSSKTTVHCG